MEPEFNRILTTLSHEEPDRVPIAEAALGYGIMSRFLDKPVTDEDVTGQAEFQYKAGYDFVPLTVGLMRPGGVTRELKGFENFGVNLMLKPDFVKKVIDKIAAIQLEGIRAVSRIPNVAAVWAVDDIAIKSGPIIISPRHYLKFIFPWYEELVHIAHQHNLKVFFHTDGVLWDLLEDLIALGIDALHPTDPTCMDIEPFKAKVGKRVCLIGIISNQVLEDGTPEEVAQLTKERLRTLVPGGGYFLGSGNSGTDDARLENYQTMLETNRLYGGYPIRVANRNQAASI